jgi:hypothetical protein
MPRINRKVIRMWWDIKDVAFAGTNITRRNGMFMSSANKIPVGSVYDIKKNIVGVLTGEDLVFSYDNLKERYQELYS